MNSTRLLLGLGLALVLAGQTSCNTKQADADSAPLAKLRAQAEQGSATAQNVLGDAYRLGKLGLATNYVEAVGWYRKAADQDNILAQNNLGRCNYLGLGVATNFVEAMQWYRKTAEQNNAWGQNHVGWCYLVGHGVATNFVEAMQWLHKAAEQNNVKALNNLGNCYYRGQGVAKDDVEAVKWYRKAAEQNDAWGQYNMGWCYAEGIGVARDKEEAVKWLHKAAVQKNAWARSYLARLNPTDPALAKDQGDAAKWLRRSATQFWKEPVMPLAAAKLQPAIVELVAEPNAAPSLAVTPESEGFMVGNPLTTPFVKPAAVGYRLIPDGLQSDTKPFSDRDYTITAVPEYLKPFTRLQTKMADKGFADDRFRIVLSAARPGYVLLALDERLLDTFERNGTPAWLEGFRPTGGKITTDDPIMKQSSSAFLVFVKQYPNGHIVLGPCCADPNWNGMYFAFFAETP